MASITKRNGKYLVRVRLRGNVRTKTFRTSAEAKAWAAQTEWLGLDVLRHDPHAGKHHSLVEFAAYFAGAGGKRETHHERSAFVLANGRWYFIDPTVPLPSMKSACICGSGKKFKHCCGKWLDD